MFFVTGFQIDVGTCGLSGPVFAGRAFVDPARVVVVIPVPALITVKVEPRFVAKFGSGPEFAGGMHGGEMASAIQSGAADAAPSLGLIAHVDSIARQNPNYLMGSVAADQITDQQGQLVVRKRIPGIQINALVVPGGSPCQHRRGNHPGLVDHVYAPVHALEKGRLNSDLVPALVGWAPVGIPGCADPLRGNKLNDVESFLRPV